MKHKKNTYDTEKINQIIKESLNDRLGDLVAKKKKYEGLTNEKQASKMNLPASSLSKYINGTSDIQATTLYKLANYYDCSIDYIIGRINYSFVENERFGNFVGLTDKSIEMLKNAQEMKSLDFTFENKLVALNAIIENLNNNAFLLNLYRYLYATFAFEKGNEYYLANPIKYVCAHDERSLGLSTTNILSQEDMTDLFYSKLQQDIHNLKLSLRKEKEETNGKHPTKNKQGR